MWASVLSRKPRRTRLARTDATQSRTQRRNGDTPSASEPVRALPLGDMPQRPSITLIMPAVDGGEATDLPPSQRTYTGARAKVQIDTTRSYANQPLPGGGRPAQTPEHLPDLSGEGPTGPTAAELEEAANRLLALYQNTVPTPRIGNAAVLMQQAEAAARANDERLANFAAKTNTWCNGAEAREARIREGIAAHYRRWSGLNVATAAAELRHRATVAPDDAPVSVNTLAAGMVEAAKLRADLDAALAADGLVKA